MPPRRIRPPARPVTFELDGDAVQGDAEASVATSLVGAGHLLLARSPKFHRPRGPACLRAGCDGCLMRIDGAPNVMACTRAPHEGMKVERQNVILTSKLDVLRATDWFFPNGMNHHELFAGVPGISQVMQAFAHRVSGLGELPDAPVPVRTSLETLEVDVLVVGGGPAGLAVVRALADGGARVLLVDDQASLGGNLLGFPRGARVFDVDVDAWLARTIEALRSHERVEVRTSATAFGVLEGDDWLVETPAGLARVRARAHVVAAGAHDGTPLFIGNDLPGVLSARAAGRLLRDGVLVGERIVILGQGPHARAFAAAAREHGAHVEALEASAEIVSARGLSSVRSVVVREGRNERNLDADAVVHDLPRAPCFEVAVQAGAVVRHEPAGYSVAVAEGGAVTHDASIPRASRLFALGEITGAPLDSGLYDTSARAVAQAVQRVLAGGA